jgi:hypothetical protein
LLNRKHKHILQNGLEKQFQKEGAGERRQGVGDAIQWESDLGKALSRAKAENKPVLMDFFNPG